MKLYEIKDEYANFLKLVEDGEIPTEAISDTLEALNGEFDEKADNIACVIKQLNAESEAIKLEEKTLGERRKNKEKNSEILKNYLSYAMQNIGKQKIETSRNLISFRKSSSLQIADENDFKQRYADLCKSETIITISKSEITSIIKNGKTLVGAELVTKQNLQIK